MRWRWPPDSFTPRSPTMVAKPFGSASMKSQRAATAAASTFVIGRIRPAVADVLHDRAVEQRDVLRHDRDRLAQAVLRDARDVLAVDQDAPALHVVEALQQREQRRFAGARLADQADALAGLDAQTEIVEHLPSAGIMERDMLERDAGATRTSGAASG